MKKHYFQRLFEDLYGPDNLDKYVTPIFVTADVGRHGYENYRPCTGEESRNSLRVAALRIHIQRMTMSEATYLHVS